MGGIPSAELSQRSNDLKLGIRRDDAHDLEFEDDGDALFKLYQGSAFERVFARAKDVESFLAVLPRISHLQGSCTLHCH